MTFFCEKAPIVLQLLSSVCSQCCHESLHFPSTDSWSVWQQPLQQTLPAVRAERRPASLYVHVANESRMFKAASDPVLVYKYDVNIVFKVPVTFYFFSTDTVAPKTIPVVLTPDNRGGLGFFIIQHSDCAVELRSKLQSSEYITKISSTLSTFKLKTELLLSTFFAAGCGEADPRAGHGGQQEPVFSLRTQRLHGSGSREQSDCRRCSGQV